MHAEREEVSYEIYTCIGVLEIHTCILTCVGGEGGYVVRRQVLPPL